MALDLDQPVKANEALTASIASASRIITELLGSQHHSLELPGIHAPADPGTEPRMNAAAPRDPTGASRDRR